MKSYAVILGGGSGRRMEADQNKVFLPLRGVPAIARAIAPFTGLCAGAVVVAEGADDLWVRLSLIRAMRTLLGLPESAVDVFVMEE